MSAVFDILKNAYAGKRVLITGHTGFKGSWLALWLKELGADVTGYALEPKTARDNFVVTRLAGRITDLRGDVRDFVSLRGAFETCKPDFVFHLAAQALVRESYEHPKETYDVNVGGTVNVFECCRVSHDVRTIINVTSDKCYENREWLWGYRENDPIGGFDPYSSSKGCSELVTAAYRNSFFNPERPQEHGKALSSVRAGNVIGGGDWAKDRILPDCIRALEAGESIKVRSPGAVRPWQFVLEPLGGYLLLGARTAAAPTKYAGAWNFGPDSASVVTVRDVAELVVTHWGSGAWEDVSQPGAPHEAGLLSLDISKARFQLGWRPALTLREAIGYSVAWYRNYADTSDMYDFCRKQIQDYMEAMAVYGT